MGKKWDKLVARIEALEKSIGIALTGKTPKKKAVKKKPAAKPAAKPAKPKPKKKTKAKKAKKAALPLPLAGTL